MQDFTRSVVAGKILLDNKSLSQVNTNKWLNKDRIWNFVFWFGMSAGSVVSLLLTPKANSGLGFSYLALAVFLITLIGVPLLVWSRSKVTFVKEDIFVNSEGRELKVPKDLPMAFFVIVCTIGSIILTGLLLDKYKISDIKAVFIFISLLFGIPTLFFIFKNCPISILFNRKVWSVMANVKGSGNLHSKNNLHQWWNDPSFRNSPGNIYYDRNR